MVISSAPTPPPPPSREAIVPPDMPTDMRTWQEHGTERTVGLHGPVFSVGDRRLWIAAGTLMLMAALVLGLLGVLSFRGPPIASAPTSPAVESRTAVAAPAAVEPPRGVPHAVAKTSSSSPRVLKHLIPKHARKHHPVAQR
jgi:hypothetical protein